jgi:predicted HTH transcriptional regulator
MEQVMTLTGSLTGKQRLVFEACKKISDGERMQREGIMELSNLVPEGKTIANRILRESHHPFAKSSKSDPSLIADILNLIDSGERVTASLVRKRLHITDRHIQRLRAKFTGIVDEKASPGGGARVWSRAKAIPKKSKPNNFIDSKQIADKILMFLKSNEWVTHHKLVSKLGVTWYPMKRAVEYLVAEGLVRKVQKTGNPAHKKISSFNRIFDYLEVV